MRDEGLDCPDLSVNEAGEIEVREEFQSIDRTDEGFRDAAEVCSAIPGRAGFGGGRGQALQSSGSVSSR